METKYYTPEIEDFIWGLEYEALWSRGWKKFKVDEWFEMSHIIDSPHELRVKYLDREDIESLGFEKNPLTKNMWQKDRDFIHFHKDDDFIFIRISRKGSGLFEGEIKNKSELKRILKMIGV